MYKPTTCCHAELPTCQSLLTAQRASVQLAGCHDLRIHSAQLRERERSRIPDEDRPFAYRSTLATFIKLLCLWQGFPVPSLSGPCGCSAHPYLPIASYTNAIQVNNTQADEPMVCVYATPIFFCRAFVEKKIMGQVFTRSIFSLKKKSKVLHLFQNIRCNLAQCMRSPMLYCIWPLISLLYIYSS